jgi:hypothetical protein
MQCKEAIDSWNEDMVGPEYSFHGYPISPFWSAKVCFQVFPMAKLYKLFKCKVLETCVLLL